MTTSACLGTKGIRHEYVSQNQDKVESWVAYIENNGAHMGSKILLVGSTNAEFITGCDHPKSHRGVLCNPPVHLVIFVLA